MDRWPPRGKWWPFYEKQFLSSNYDRDMLFVLRGSGFKCARGDSCKNNRDALLVAHGAGGVCAETIGGGGGTSGSVGSIRIFMETL